MQQSDPWHRWAAVEGYNRFLTSVDAAARRYTPGMDFSTDAAVDRREGS
jgi:hypothetical protein